MIVEEVFDTYYTRVYSFVLFRVQNIQEAEDITSNVFLKVVKNLGQYREEASISTWLISIALNEVRAYYRKRSLHFPLEYAENVPARERLEDEVLANEQARMLYAAIARLTERQRDVVLLRYYGEMSNKEIARLLRLTETNVETILSRAKKSLKNLMN